MFSVLQFSLEGGARLDMAIRRPLAAGATGRDPEKVRAHIARQASLGIKPPVHVPMLYPLMPTLVTNATDIGVIGADSTPEIEVVLFHVNGVDYLTVGSDHTDRRIEAASALQGKNSCPKIVGTSAWRVSEVIDHWDALSLRSTCGETVLQEGNLAHNMAFDDLMAFVRSCDGDRAEGRMVFSGTVPTFATPPPGNVAINLSLHDPVTKRTITHTYTVHVRLAFFQSGSLSSG